MRGGLAAIASSRGSAAHASLIRPCGATVPLLVLCTTSPVPGESVPPWGKAKKNLTQLHRRVRFMY